MKNDAYLSNQEIGKFCQFDLHPEYKRFKKYRSNIQPYIKNKLFYDADSGVSSNYCTLNSGEFLNFSSYNYLGFSGDERVNDAVIEAVRRYGTSVSASRLVSGEKLLHQTFERELADFLGVEASLLFTTGHATNVSTISHLFGQRDLIFYDELSHNSLLQGARFSGAVAMSFKHNDFMMLDQLLEQHRRNYERVLVIIEGVYSMDGDIPLLPEFVRIKNKHYALLMIDEAHSIGVLGKTGRGICEHFNVDPNNVDILMGTISKAFASCGGYIAGTEVLIDLLKHTAPAFIFSVGMTPANTAAGLAALRLLREEPNRVKQLHENGHYFRVKAKEYPLDIGLSEGTPIIPVMTRKPLQALKLSDALYDLRINVKPIIHPAVPRNQERLRFFLTTLHDKKQIDEAIKVVARLLMGEGVNQASATI